MVCENREILFRGKIKDNGMWVYGSLINNMAFDTQTGKVIPFILDNTASEDVDSWDHIENGVFEVDPRTVGQYTGTKDKNNIKIFEDDIVEAWSEGAKAVGVIKQRVDGMWLIYPAWQDGQSWGLCPNSDGKTTVEFIGDIHDNPELLGERK